jgi:RNA polymerase sigma factor (sigma-70 family)
VGEHVTASAEPTSGDLVERAGESFDEVFLHEYGGLVRLAAAMCGVPARAEEVVQEAFAAALPLWDELDRPGAYLRRSVVNGSINVTRRRDRGEAPLSDGMDVAIADAGLADESLRAALDDLPTPQRAVVVLRFYLDLSLADIAATVDRPLNTVKSDLRRALASLSEELSR